MKFLVSLLLATASAMLVCNAAPANNQPWDLARAKTVTATNAGRSAILVRALVDLDTPCYETMIDQQTPLDPKSPRFIVKQRRLGEACIDQKPEECTVERTSVILPRPKFVRVASRDELRNIPVKPPPVSGTPCKHH